MSYLYLATSLNPNGSSIFTLTVVIAGLGIVIGTLALLIFIFSLFGKSISKAQERAKDKKIPKTPGEKPKNEIPLPPPIIDDEGISPEIVAAISAAVYMQENGEVKIKSIRRKRTPVSSRNAWAQAAVIENTKPF